MSIIQALLLGILLGGVYSLLASGLSLIFGVMRVVNIAQGAMLILGAFLSWTLWSQFGFDPILSTILVAPAMFAFGYALYYVTVRRISEAPLASSVLLTVGIALVIEGAIGVIWGNNSHAIRPSYGDQSYTLGSVVIPKTYLFGSLMAAVVLVILSVIISRTWSGRAIRAASVNPDGARLVGVDVNSVAAMAMGLGVATAGAGGAIVGVLYPFVPGAHYEWIARLLGIVVLGGLGSISGAALGAVLFGVAEIITSTYISPAWATAIPFVVICLVLLFRPQGILGKRAREDLAA
ncbi:branched-chain amino acid ABC transporter permease [Streptomyces sp. NPDC057621]|uniref:branched-chain amino acid ABC transporter permease n=1 Tax=Streptomyces sp. NPDC057621 TaxID=3346186 RepID=UPI003680F20B